MLWGRYINYLWHMCQLIKIRYESWLQGNFSLYVSFQAWWASFALSMDFCVLYIMFIKMQVLYAMCCYNMIYIYKVKLSCIHMRDSWIIWVSSTHPSVILTIISLPIFLISDSCSFTSKCLFFPCNSLSSGGRSEQEWGHSVEKYHYHQTPFTSSDICTVVFGLSIHFVL